MYWVVESADWIGERPLLKMEQMSKPSENMSDWGEQALDAWTSGAIKSRSAWHILGIFVV